MPYTLDQLDTMTIDEAQALPFADRDALLDLIIADGRKRSTADVSHRIGLYSDYFDEDLTRMLKVKAVRVLCRGTTESGFDGVIVGDTDEEHYRAAFRHLETTLKAAGTSYDRVVTMMVFLKNIENWPMLNEVYKEFVQSQPCRAVIGTTGLAEKTIVIEIVEALAYRVSP